ncbi:atrophin-1-like [Loxodonta africana]|uniref:atrophin-1-like n=1 Tax=Loxodonta africana TaxID=9785 RepID=UPI0030CB887A
MEATWSWELGPAIGGRLCLLGLNGGSVQYLQGQGQRAGQGVGCQGWTPLGDTGNEEPPPPRAAQGAADTYKSTGKAGAAADGCRGRWVPGEDLAPSRQSWRATCWSWHLSRSPRAQREIQKTQQKGPKVDWGTLGSRAEPGPPPPSLPDGCAKALGPASGGLISSSPSPIASNATQAVATSKPIFHPSLPRPAESKPVIRPFVSSLPQQASPFQPTVQFPPKAEDSLPRYLWPPTFPQQILPATPRPQCAGTGPIVQQLPEMQAEGPQHPLPCSKPPRAPTLLWVKAEAAPRPTFLTGFSEPSSLTVFCSASSPSKVSLVPMVGPSLLHGCPLNQHFLVLVLGLLSEPPTHTPTISSEDWCSAHSWVPSMGPGVQ